MHQTDQEVRDGRLRQFYNDTFFLQERTRLAGEIEVLRRRLHDAEQGWMESKEECIALTELLNKAEREVGNTDSFYDTFLHCPLCNFQFQSEACMCTDNTHESSVS